MSILFKMVRLTPGAYENFVATGRLGKGFRDEQNEEVDQAWGILERILSAGPAYAEDAINGGRVLPNAELDYGGLRVHSPNEVIAISLALGELTAQDIERRYRELDFTGAFKADGPRPSYDLDDILGVFESLRDFYAETAGKGAAMLIYMH